MSKSLNILNVWVDAITRIDAMERVESILENGKRPHYIFASNPEKNYSVPKDKELYEIYRNADLLLPDGIGMVLAARLLYGAKLKRIPGSEFIFDICSIAQKNGRGVFFFGSKDWVGKKACNLLMRKFPDLKIAGYSNGYVRKESMPNLIRSINDSKAEVLFVALGSPRQEKWIATYAEQLTTVKICQGIGGTLDTIAGNVQRAPKLWCRYNMEWLYRLIKEPKRVRRQKVLPLFALNVLYEWVAAKKSLSS